MHKDLNEAEKAELVGLNAAVDKALADRCAWLDAKMHEKSDLKIGDDIYDVDTGMTLGTVSKLYRYWTNQNPLLDTSLSFDYQYETSHNCFDNTSRQTCVSFGTLEDARKRAGGRAAHLAGPQLTYKEMSLVMERAAKLYFGDGEGPAS